MLEKGVIVFVGTVGSGKSTHSKLLATILRRRGLRTRFVFIKSFHGLSHLVLDVILPRLTGVHNRMELIARKPHIIRALLPLILMLDFISFIYKFLLEIYIPLRLGRVIIVEEYIPATLADYAYLAWRAKTSNALLTMFFQAYLRLLALAPMIITFYLDAKDTELLSRWKTRGTPLEDKIYIAMQRSVLRKLASMLSKEYYELDTTNKPLGSIHASIIRNVLELKASEK